MKKIVCLLVFIFASSANATLLSFDDLESAGSGNSNHSSYSNQGFQLTTTSAGFASWYQDNSAYNASAALFNNHANGVTRLSAIDGSLFGLTSIDLDTVYANDNGPSPVEFLGYDINGQLVATENITLTSDAWVTLDFSSSFSNIAYVEWTQTTSYHQFDNVLINGSTSVPEPSSVVLLVLALAGVGLSRKRLL
ncbi:PEP-CTERM sorting domain-containing protein [Colwellia psychrerythraea]|uniref:PEP motif putative anchor domain protein n=1 Tax=Colwellia psychrerythraea TaxID=28229 RepID=A0A099KMG2_COLPS|nr:PEP-CTERM sorting domain-containing protein [Colwellia psychrerythraea]KGJ91621.1 PEP motif putative anchor domain protein [Colwellia psychrerythraea]